MVPTLQQKPFTYGKGSSFFPFLNPFNRRTFYSRAVQYLDFNPNIKLKRFLQFLEIMYRERPPEEVALFITTLKYIMTEEGITTNAAFWQAIEKIQRGAPILMPASIGSFTYNEQEAGLDAIPLNGQIAHDHNVSLDLTKRDSLPSGSLTNTEAGSATPRTPHNDSDSDDHATTSEGSTHDTLSSSQSSLSRRIVVPPAKRDSTHSNSTALTDTDEGSATPRTSHHGNDSDEQATSGRASNVDSDEDWAHP